MFPTPSPIWTGCWHRAGRFHGLVPKSDPTHRRGLSRSKSKEPLVCMGTRGPNPSIVRWWSPDGDGGNVRVEFFKVHQIDMRQMSTSCTFYCVVVFLMITAQKQLETQMKPGLTLEIPPGHFAPIWATASAKLWLSTPTHFPFPTSFIFHQSTDATQHLFDCQAQDS